MNDKRKPPTIAKAVFATVLALFGLAGCFTFVKSAASGGAPDSMMQFYNLVNGVLIALAGMNWVQYLRAYVDFRIGQLRQELQAIASQPPTAAAPAKI